MTKATYPALCGGTFFTLLLEARQARSGKKEQLYGKRDGLSEPETLAGLIRVMYPEFTQPSGELTFRTNTADYKACRNNGGNMPFFDREIKAFDNRVKSDYRTALALMCKFINRYIEVGGSVKRDEWLVKALLDLIDNDQSIGNADAFYVCESGQALTKVSLRSVTTLCLPAFLLGVWHFAVVCRQDNTVGKDTFDEWCPPNNHNPRAYTGTMGDSITRSITLTMPEMFESEDEATATTENEPNTECNEPYVKPPTSNPAPHTTTQIINSPAVFFNSGANGIQINNTGILNIDRGRKT